MTKKGKSRSAKTASMTGLVFGILMFNTVLTIAVVLLVSGLVFFRQANSIYDELNKSIVGEAISQIDDDVIKDLANACDSVYRGIEDPGKLYNDDKDAYFAKYDEISGRPDFIEIRDKLTKLCHGTQASEIDIVIFYPKDEKGIYIMDARDVELVKCGDIFDVEKKYFDEGNKTFNGFYSYSTYFGKVWTSGNPIHTNDENDYYVYMTSDIPTKIINGKVQAFVIRLVMMSLVLSFGVSAAAIFQLRRGVVRPVKEISNLAETFVDNYGKRSETGKSNVFDDVKPGEVEEMNTLLASMQTMEREMNGYLVDIKKASAEQERIALELGLASKIQTAMIPNKFPPFPEHKEFSIFASMTPAKEVGGDFFDFYLIDEDHLGVVIADVAGKGIPAALLMMVSKIIIKNYALMERSPARILELVNNQLCSNNQVDMFVTAWLGILTMSEGKFVAASAGHEYPYIKNGRRFEMMKDKHGFVLGGMEDSKYTDYEFTLGKGDALFIYTDGLPEATNSDNEMFGNDRILEHLNAVSEGIPELIIDHMKKTVKGFVGNAQQFDDLTMLALKINEIPVKKKGSSDTAGSKPVSSDT